MQIELVVDENCISIDSILEIRNRLANDFTDELISVKCFDSADERMVILGIKVLPAWIIDDQLICVNPWDYNRLRNMILQKKLMA